MLIKDLISRYREDHHNITPRELAKLTGINPTTLASIEAGYDTLTKVVMQKIANFFNVTLIITPHEELKYFDAYADIADTIQNSALTEEAKEFIVKKENQFYIDLAMMIKELDGIDNPIIRKFLDYKPKK